MIKQIKKISLCFLSLVFVLLFISVSNVRINATDDADLQERETVLSEYAIRVGDLETTNLLGGVTLYKQKAKTIYNGVDTGVDDINSAKYRYSHNTVQWVELPKTSEDVKVVVWSEGTANGWASSTVRNTAMHYEETHPGWMVVAAVNGDGFDINGTKQPNNIHVQEGDVLQTSMSPIQIGWQDDNTPVFGNSAKLSSVMYVEIMENGKVVESLPVAAVNTSPSATGITVLTKDMADAVDLTGYTVYVGEYELCRISKSTNLPFVKGTINSITTELGVDKPNETENYKNIKEFYLVSKDGSLDGKVSEGTYVRCQYPLTGDWADINNVISGFGSRADDNAYSAQVLKDGQPLGAGSTDLFVNTTHPRTIVGFKEDGSTVLMVADGRGKADDYEQGLSYFQEGEMMRLAGCTNAFNLDGGGSSTLIVKNAYGGFDVVNRPSDGSERPIGNAILFVMRDPGVSWDVKNTTRFDAAFSFDPSIANNAVVDASVTIGDQTASLIGGSAVISGLKEDTEYIATINYQIRSEEDPDKLLSGSYNISVKTKPFTVPGSSLQFMNINKNSVSLVKRDTETASWVSNVVVKMNNYEYVLGSESKLEITELIEDTEYVADITYDVTDPITGNVYHGSEQLSFKTLNYSLPIIETFEIARQTDSRITFRYAYSDPDNLVELAYLYCNKEQYVLSTKSGTLTINDLDFENNTYSFYILIGYDAGTASLKQIKSDKIEIDEVILKSMITYELDGGLLPLTAPQGYVEGEGLATLPTPTKEGYKFTGWMLNDVLVESISADQVGDITLVATWEEVEEAETPGAAGGCKMGSSVKTLFTLTTLLGLLVVGIRKRK